MFGVFSGFLFLFLFFLGCAREATRDPAELRVGIAIYPGDFDPRSGADQASDRLHALVYDGLFENGDDLQPAPVLVEKIIAAGPLLYEFRLREGVKFHDGRPFTSADAADAIRQIISGALPSPRRGDLEDIQSVETPDALTLRLILKRPFAALLANLNFGIPPAGTTAGQARTAPLGTGAWRFVSAATGREIRLAANPGYFRGAPGMQKLTLRAIGDAEVRALEMKRGALDLISDDLPADTLLALGRDPRFVVSSRPGTGFSYFVFNCKHKPFDDPRVRRALAMLLDREAVVRDLYGGRGVLADSLLPIFHWSYAPPAAGEALRFDPAAADRLLDDAGLRRNGSGERFAFVYRASDSPETLAVAQLYQDELRRHGIAMRIVSSYWGFYFEALKKGDFDLAGGRWIGLTDPDVYRLRLGSAYIPPKGLNRGFYSNVEFDRLLTVGGESVELSVRRAAYGRIQAIFRRDLPYLPIFHAAIAVIARKELTGVNPAVDGSFRSLRMIRRSGPPAGKNRNL